MKAAADCNTFKASFPTAMKYCADEGTTSGRFSDDFWIQMRQRRQDSQRCDLILSPPPWNLSPYLGPQTPQGYTVTPSLPGCSRVQFRALAIPGCRSALERRQDKNQSSHRCLRISLRNSVVHRGTLHRRRDDRWFIFKQILTQVIVKKFAPSDLILIAHLRFCLRNFRFPRSEQRTPGETSGRHSC